MIETNEAYWDCECEGHPEDYIHSKLVKSCELCKAVADESPDSCVRELTDRVRYLADLEAGVIDPKQCRHCSWKFAASEVPDMIEVGDPVQTFNICNDSERCEARQEEIYGSQDKTISATRPAELDSNGKMTQADAAVVSAFIFRDPDSKMITEGLHQALIEQCPHDAFGNEHGGSMGDICKNCGAMPPEDVIAKGE